MVVQERVTATCIGMMFNGLGGAMSYLIGILMTPEGPDNSSNSTGTKEKRTNIRNIDYDEGCSCSERVPCVYKQEIYDNLYVMAVPRH